MSKTAAIPMDKEIQSFQLIFTGQQYKKYLKAIVQLNRILKRRINSIAYGVHGEGLKWAMSIKNDSLYLKTICQLNLGKLKEAYSLIGKHLAQRRRGVYSDFTKKQVKRKEQYIINELNNKVVK